MTEEVLEHESTRRGFINWFLGTCVGAFLLTLIYPVVRYLIPPPSEESTAASLTLQIKPEDVKPNTGQIFKFGNRPGILIRTPGGELRAFSAVCTHLNCTVQYRTDLAEMARPSVHWPCRGPRLPGKSRRARPWPRGSGIRSRR